MPTDTVTVTVDLFPARVRLPNGTILVNARVVATEDGDLRIYVDGPGQPELFYQRDALSHEGQPSSGFIFLVEEGTVAAVRSGGCGCGSMLKNFRPFGDVRVVKS